MISMDNIDRMMKEADRLGFGVSYGKYRAAYPNGSADVLPSPPKPKPPERPSGICKMCGKNFVKSHANTIYCGPECKIAAERKRQRDWYHNKTKVPAIAVCIICGADFKPKKVNCKTCGQECRRENNRRLSARWRAAQKEGATYGVSL